MKPNYLTTLAQSYIDNDTISTIQTGEQSHFVKTVGYFARMGVISLAVCSSIAYAESLSATSNLSYSSYGVDKSIKIRQTENNRKLTDQYQVKDANATKLNPNAKSEDRHSNLDDIDATGVSVANNSFGQMGYTSNTSRFSHGNRYVVNRADGSIFAPLDSNYSDSIVLSIPSYSNVGSHQNSASAATLNLPELSDGDRFVDQYQHLALGQWSLQQLNAHLPLLDDAWVQEELSNVVWDINAQARSQAPLAFVIINDPSINAFAIPGGVIGLNVGTVLAANSLDEVASVLAHEVAHLSQRHYEHSQEANKKALWIQVGGLLAAIAASTADGDAAAAIMMGSQTAAMDSRMAFSRDNEREADRVGMQILAQTGYDPRAMPRFFATLNQQNQLNSTKKSYLPSFVMSHPLSSERLSEAQTRANSYPPMPLSQAQRHQHRFDLLQWRMRLAAQQTSEVALTSAAKQSVGAKMALADWYGQHGRYAEAQALFEQIAQLPASERQAIQPLFAITQAQVAGYQGQWQQAERLLQVQQALYPERRDLRLYLADVWLHNGKAQQVQAIVKPLLIRQPHDLSALARMQMANEQLAKQADKSAHNQLAQIATINALRYRSQSERWRANFEAAQVSLQQAKHLAEALIEQQNAVEKVGQTKTNTSNVQPLLATINSEMAALKAAKDYKP
ncbi:M48 family metalloprotease [Psychrobacter sp. I-STPA10]|uniref:M48 family metalloprotease n=1 Tax=Psychrobacter sp. I-STPA10 TaxID=2585769 RepID=UPI001E4E56FD|nr:M48 family metalloprotease [Psychrobacter sp. I-STPA10]